MTAPAIPRGKPAAQPPAGAAIFQLPVDAIDVGANVRVNPGELDELATSIREHGVLQPIRVRSVGERWVVMWGQRRLLAARKAGLERIPAMVDVDEKSPATQSIEQLVENIQRADLNPVEEAAALREVLAADPALTQAELAKRLGRSAPWVANTLGLLEAAPEVQEFIRDGQLTASHAKALKGLAPKTQASLAKEAVKSGTSAHGMETAVQDFKRDEEWRKEREANQRQASEAVRAAWQRRVDDLAKKKGATSAPVRVYEGYYAQGKAGHIIGLLKKAGFTDVVESKGELDARPGGGVCDCVAWRVTFAYSDQIQVGPACLKPAHQVAKSKADDDKRRQKYATQEAVQEELKRILPAALEAEHPSPLVMRLLLWHALDYDLGHWSAEHGGVNSNPWKAIAALDDAALPAELGKSLAKSLRDRYGWKIGWEDLAAELGLSVAEPEPTGKKGR